MRLVRPYNCARMRQILPWLLKSASIVILATAAVCRGAAPATGPDVPFPQSWTGTWRGPCAYVPADAMAKPRQFEMELMVQPTADPSRYTWKIIYVEGAKRQERPYELVVVDAAAGRFAIDEKNSIVIESRFIDGALFGQFVVGTSVITASYRRDGDRMVMELLTTDVKGAAVTGGNDVPQVQTHPVMGLQRAILERLPEIQPAAPR